MKVRMARVKAPSYVWAVLGVLVLLATACSPAADTEGSGGGDVKNADVITMVIGEDPDSFDPAAIDDRGMGRAVLLHGYDRLLEFAPGSSDLVPSIASEVPTLENGGISPDGLTYTFTLRDDVTFQDGSELNSEDVVYSWNRVMTMNLPEGQASTFEPIKEMSAPDPTTFVVTLDEVDASFLNNVVVTMPASIVNSDVVESNGGVQAGTPNDYMAQNLAGSGPYKVTNWERGERVSFEVNEGYWGKPAKVDMRWDIAADGNVWELGLRAGDYDIIPGSPESIGDLQGAPGVVVESDLPGLQLLQIGFNLNIDEDELPEGDTIPADFFHDKRVRQAFNYAFDYDAMRESTLGGAATRGSFFIPEGMYGFDPKAPTYDYDLDEAERLFKEAGWWDEGFTLSIVVEGGNLFEEQALILKDGIEEINPKFRINVLALPEARFDEIMATQPISAAMWSWTTPEFGDPHPYFMDSAHPDGRWGELAGLGKGYDDPDAIASLIDAAKRELDPDARAEMYAELQQMMYEEAPSVLPGQENAVLAYRDWLNDVAANPLWPRPSVKLSYYDKGQ